LPIAVKHPSHSYISGIDGLRAMAVLSVMAYHLKAQLLTGGFVGVDVFFVISGYVVTTSIIDRKFTSFSELVFYFYARRFLRIVPALIAMLFVASIATIAFVPAAWLSDSNRNTALFAFFGLSNICLALNADDYFGPRTDYNPFAHTWSLGVEEQFYLLFPFIIGVAVFLHTRKAVFLALGLSVLSFVTAALLTSRAPLFSFFQLPSRFWELGIGLLIALTSPSWLRQIEKIGIGSLNFLGGCLLLLLALSFIFCDENSFPFPWAILPVVATAGLLMVLGCRRKTAISNLLSMPALSFIGLVSYSLYLWHWPIYVLLRWTTGLTSLLDQTTALVLTFLAAVASYFIVERPVRYSRFVAALPRVAVVALFCLSTVFAAFVTRGAFRFADQLSLSVTTNHDVWSNDQPFNVGYLSFLNDKNIAYGDSRIGFGPATGRQILVAGDSHAGAYARMLARYSSDHAVPIIIYSTPGCPFLNLRTPTRLLEPKCAAFNASARGDIVDRSGPLTTVFLPGLRIDRFQDQWGGGNSPAPAIDIEAIEEARIFIEALSKRGANVILEAPTPVFWSPPFRCSDWFNRNNPICSQGFQTERIVLEARRADVIDAERSLAASIRRLVIWDPVPTLCDATYCRAVRDGKPLFYDGDHLSGYGNDLLYSAFTKQLIESEKLASRPDP
jgi:peptidoglycan/LPS O-acetylase OafA/YrhL